jgi:hypothetical protein
MTLKLPLQLKLQGLCVSFLNEEGSSNERQVVIHVIRFRLHFPSKVSLAYTTIVTTVLILLLPEHLEWLWFITEAFPNPCLYKMFSLFWAIVLVLKFSALISGTCCVSSKFDCIQKIILGGVSKGHTYNATDILQRLVTLQAQQYKGREYVGYTTNYCFRLWFLITRAVKMTVSEILMLLMVRCCGFFGDTFDGLNVGG